MNIIEVGVVFQLYSLTSNGVFRVPAISLADIERRKLNHIQHLGSIRPRLASLGVSR